MPNTPDDPRAAPLVPRELTEEARRRIRAEMDARKITNRDMSRRILLGEGSIGQILTGKVASPSLENFLAIIGDLGLNPSWVLFGFGEKYVADTPKTGDSSPGLRPITAGVDCWLLDTPIETTREERAWMRSIDWPAPDRRLPDSVYEHVLGAYREACAFLRQLPDSAHAD